MKRKFAVLIAMILAMFSMLTGCGAQEAKIEAQTVKIAALSGPTGMAVAPMMVETPQLADGVTLDFTLDNSPDQITADIINGTYQIATVPSNLAVSLYNKTGGKVILGAVNTLGVMTIIGQKDLPVENIADLKGYTVGVTGQGYVPEYAMKALLEKNGMHPDTDVNLKFYGDHMAASTALDTGEIQIAMLAEPFATSAVSRNPNLKILINLNDAWSQAYGTQMMMGTTIVNREWAEKNPELLKRFMDAYKSSSQIIMENTDQSAKYVVDVGILPNEELAKKAIPACAITFLTPSEAKADLNAFLGTLHQFNAQVIGGDLPAIDSAFYSLTW